MSKSKFGTVFLSSLLLAACVGVGAAPATPAPSALTVVATTSVFADLVRQVGGERVAVRTLVPNGGEVHTFDPAPSDAQAMSGASLLVMNGLHLDEWLEPFAQQAGAANVPVLKLGENLDEVDYIEEEGGANPHLWLDLAYAEIYVDRIRLKLIELDPAGQETYDANAQAFAGRLHELDAQARTEFAQLPEGDRRVVAFHDAFPYFARAYDLEIVGVVVDAPGQDPSAGEVAQLIEAIRATGARAILAETQFSSDLVQTLADETGVAVVSDLFTDTLGDAPYDTFEAAFRYDAEQILAALRR